MQSTPTGLNKLLASFTTPELKCLIVQTALAVLNKLAILKKLSFDFTTPESQFDDCNIVLSKGIKCRMVQLQSAVC